MPRFIVTIKVDNGEARFISTSDDMESCWKKQKREEQKFEILRIVQIPEEIEKLHVMLTHQCMLWDSIRNLERLYEETEPDELQDVQDWLDDVCVGIDSPVDITDHKTMFELMNSLRKYSGLDQKDFSEFIHE